MRHLLMTCAVIALLAISAATNAATILWNTENTDGAAAPSPDDIGWTDLLTAEGHDVTRANMSVLDAGKIATMEAADLVIFSRDANSGNYTQGTEVADWNAITTPLIMLNQYLARSSRFKWVNNTDTPGTAADLHADVPGHQIFAGVTLDGSDNVDYIDTPNVPSVNIAGTNNGTVLASPAGSTGEALIVLWEPGTEYYPGSGQTPGGRRVFFGGGFDDNDPKGAYNLNPIGERIFLNMVDMLTVPEPSTLCLSALGLLGLLGLLGRGRRRKR